MIVASWPRSGAGIFSRPGPGEMGEAGRPAQIAVLPARTVEDRIAAIRTLVKKSQEDPENHRLVMRILNAPRSDGGGWTVPPKDWRAELKAIVGWAQKNIAYRRDVWRRDTFRSARRTTELRGGDCDDMTIWAASALSIAGFPVRFRVVSTRSDFDFNHIFAEVGVPPRNPDRWLPVDLTLDDPFSLPPVRFTASRVFPLEGGGFEGYFGSGVLGALSFVGLCANVINLAARLSRH